MMSLACAKTQQGSYEDARGERRTGTITHYELGQNRNIGQGNRCFLAVGVPDFVETDSSIFCDEGPICLPVLWMESCANLCC